MITLVNECVLITANGWSSGQATGFRRTWDISVAQSLSGAQDRQANRSKPNRALAFTVVALSLAERAQLIEEVRESLKTGRTAVPIWGRGQIIASNLSGTSLATDPETSSYDFEAGDFVFLFDGVSGRWEVAEIDSVTGTNTYTLSSAPNAPFGVGNYVYPLFYGLLTIDSAKVIDPESGEASLTVSEPLGSGSLLDSGVSCPAPVGTYTGGDVTFCTGALTVSVETACGPYYGLSWNSVPYAQNYQIKYAFTPGGPYTVYGNTTDLEYPVPRFLETAYYVVAAQAGDTEIESNEVTIEALTIEGCMRAFQERHVVALGAEHVWDAAFTRDTDAVAPSSYPALGFYDADIAAGGATRETELVQALSDLFYSTGILQKFIELDPDLLLSDADSRNDLLYFEDAITFDRRSPFFDTPPTISVGNQVYGIRDIASYICKLEFIPLDLYQLGGSPGHGDFFFNHYEIKNANVSGAANEAAARTALIDGWENPSNNWGATSSTPGYPFTGGVAAFVQNSPLWDGSSYWVGDMTSVRYEIQAPVSGFGSAGEVHLYQSFTLELAFPPYAAGQMPPGELDWIWREQEEFQSLPLTTFQSARYADQTPLLPEADLERRWNLYSPMVLIVKRASEHWIYIT